ncbi:MAG: 30S ribosomal protein S9 [Clostridia bacterium]|nr:30S ribosomal protein S9 [Clostridia bacterium]
MPKKTEINRKFTYATGKRKSAIARVRLTPGTGKITINNKDLSAFYTIETLKAVVMRPFSVSNLAEKYDVIATVKGGGFSSQAGAIAHGISKALSTTSEEAKGILKRNGLLTRDSRVKERHKYGLKKARKAPQFSKR